MSQSFKNRSVVITGSSRGIGLGIAKGFAAAGAKLTLIADDAAVIEIAASIGARGVFADITDASAVDGAFASLSSIDVLINNAGYEQIGRAHV